MFAKPFDIDKTLASLKGRAEWIGLRYVQEKQQTRGVRGGYLDKLSFELQHGLQIEVLANGHRGYASTSDLETEAVLKAFERALQMTKLAATMKLYSSPLSVRPSSQGTYESPVKTPLDQNSMVEITNHLISACRALKVSEAITQTQADVVLIETREIQASSSGTRIDQTFYQCCTEYSATAEVKGRSQKRSLNGWSARCRQGGVEVLELGQALVDCPRVGQEAIELAMAPTCPSESCDLLLMPDQMLLQIHESIGHPLELDRILGDERNYAGSSFVKLSDFGKLEYGSNLLNVTFDPTIPHEFASYAYDQSGLAASREFLIKDGILLRGLGSTESQARSHVPGVANFRASSWNRAPIDRMANVNVEPGTSSLKEMIVATERGVLMSSNVSWSIDDYRRKFQFGCEFGRLIRDGQLGSVVRNPNYRGVSVPFWQSLKMVGNKSEVLGSLYCGKGEPNQIIRVGHSSPPCLFSNVEVFGGES